MHPHHASLLAVLSFMTIGCAEGLVRENADGGTDRLTPENDPANCGKPGNVCVSAAADACYEGHCRCNSDKDCHWPDQCREGVCQSGDPSGALCRNDAECAMDAYCIHERCTPRTRLTERCDGFDNDGDGETDEAADTDLPCYSGPPASLGRGACHAGKRSCKAGKYTVCENEFPPHAEVGRFSCDGEDSDCDGCTDGTGGATLGCERAAPPIVDFVVMLDNSGSMSGYIAACKEAAKFLSKFDGDPRFMFSLMSVSHEPSAPSYLKVLLPLTDFKTFRDALDPIVADGAGDEPTYDAVYRTAKGDFDADIGFRADSLPVYIVFGDEPPGGFNSKLMPPMTEDVVCKAVDARGALLAVLTEPGMFPEWDVCAAKYTFPLSSDPAVMTMKLDSVLSLPCFKDGP